jgi:stage IV sporulation protein B
MTRKCIYRRILLVVLLLGIVTMVAYQYNIIKNSIPDKMRLVKGSEQELNFNGFTEMVRYEESTSVTLGQKTNIPSGKVNITPISLDKFYAREKGTYTIQCKLFGFINLKNIDIDVVEAQYLIPSGEPIGIYMETNGVLVIGTGVVNGIDGLNYEPAYNIVKSGDYILSVNGEAIENKKELIEKVNLYGSNELVLEVRRNGDAVKLSVKPITTGSGEYKMGIWVRDNTQGIGTLTFVDENGNFGALGHGINDVDTSQLMELKEGQLYNTKILSIIKGQKGNPGELSGVIHYKDSEIIGEILSNTRVGIFGQIEMEHYDISEDGMEVGYKQEIEVGPAIIRSSVSGLVKEYDVEIKEINLSDNDANKGLVIKIVDEELLELTGGIVQGMSGSPIIQNNKLVGAVTHVFVQDSTSGFGIFIENMLEKQN